MTTGFFWDERCFWHAGGNYVFTMPVGGLVQPLAAGGLPENPETKRRMKNLMEVTGLFAELDTRSAAPANREALARVHPETYLDDFKRLSDAGGGELGHAVPFARGGYELAALSAGLSIAAVDAGRARPLRSRRQVRRCPGTPARMPSRYYLPASPRPRKGSELSNHKKGIRYAAWQ